MLIYFNRALQDRAIGLFREALCRQGFLGFGAKESIRFSSHAGAFQDFAPRRANFSEDAPNYEPRWTGGGGGDRRFRGRHRGARHAAAGASRQDCAPPVIIVLHLPRDRPSVLAEIFARKCALPVREAQDKEPVRARNRVFRAE